MTMSEYVKNEIKEYGLDGNDILCASHDGLCFYHIGEYTALFKKTAHDDAMVADFFSEYMHQFATDENERENGFYGTFLKRLADDIDRAIKISDRVCYRQAFNDSFDMELIYLAPGTNNVYDDGNKVYKENKGVAKILHNIDSAMKYAVDTAYRDCMSEQVPEEEVC